MSTTLLSVKPLRATISSIQVPLAFCLLTSQPWYISARRARYFGDNARARIRDAMRYLRKFFWVLIAVIGALGLGMIAASRGEPLNAVWLVAAAGCIYLLGFRFYSRFIAYRILELNDRRATPAERLEDGRDFLPTNKWGKSVV